MALFDAKQFNAEVFDKYTQKVADLNKNELIKSGVLNDRTAELRSMFADQVGGNYQTVPIKGLIDGAPVNYDGGTDITSGSRKTYAQKMIVVGRARGWVEKDFASDITGGVNFLPVAQETEKYWQDVYQKIMLSTLKGVFSMTGGANGTFVTKHTTDLTGASDKTFNATTLNSALQKACGDNKRIFSIAIMHSVVATNLENLQILQYFKAADANGLQRDVGIATLNGKVVLVDDNMPTEDVYAATADVALDTSKTYYTRSGSAGAYVYTAVASPDVANIASYYEFVGTNYTTYALGKGAFDYGDFGAVVPSEMDRDPKTNGGQTTLYTRKRRMYAPHGISFEVAAGTPISPTDAQLETGANWTLVHDGQSTKSYINHREIPIARIITRG